MFQRRKIVVLLLICLSFSACLSWVGKGVKSPYKAQQIKGVYHRIKSGETLWSIARAYQVSIQELAEINNISDPNLIEVDDVIFIPHAERIIDDVVPPAERSGALIVADKKQETNSMVRPLEEVATPKASKEEPLVALKKPAEEIPREGALLKTTTPIGDSGSKPVARDEMTLSRGLPVKSNVEDKTKQIVEQRVNGEKPIQFDRKRFIWPVRGKVVSRFGIQPNGMYYNGITIAAREGAPVLAVADGTVIFSAPLKDYGETMIIKHEGNYATVYSNLGSRMKKVDNEVRKGDRIALLDKSEKKGEAYLSFEIRHKNKARNPLFFLP